MSKKDEMVVLQFKKKCWHSDLIRWPSLLCLKWTLKKVEMVVLQLKKITALMTSMRAFVVSREGFEILKNVYTKNKGPIVSSCHSFYLTIRQLFTCRVRRFLSFLKNFIYLS